MLEKSAWEITYALPVFIRDVTILQGEVDLLLELSRHFIVAIHQIRIAISGLDQILNLLGCDASPKEVSADRLRDAETLPMPVLPALMILDGDLDCISVLPFGDLDAGILALLVLATCAVVGTLLWG
jgi:hypothetical protein